MSRPKLPPDEIRSTTLRVPVTPSEKANFMARIAAEGTTPSLLLRKLVAEWLKSPSKPIE